jgi:hypothetical protein
MVKRLVKLQHTIEGACHQVWQLEDQCEGALGMNVAMNIGTLIKVI